MDSILRPIKVSNKIFFLATLCLFLVSLSHGQWLETTIPVGVNPNHVVYNSTNNTVYTANWGYGANSVTVIDGATNSVITTIPVGGNPHSLCYNPINNKVYANFPYGNCVRVIDGATNSVIATIPVGMYPYGPFHNPTNNKVYTPNFQSNSVTVIDGETNSVITTITLGTPAGLGPYDIGYNPTNNKVYCSNWSNGTVAVIDGATNSVITTIPVGGWPKAFVHNPTNNRVYCGNADVDNCFVTVINGATNSIITTIPVKEIPFALCYNPTNNKVYCANQWRDTVTVINCATNSIITTIPVGNEPSALFYNQINNKVYCANRGILGSPPNYVDSLVTIIDGATDSVIKTIVVGYGSGPSAFAYNPLYNRVYVANYYGNTVSVIRDSMVWVEECSIFDSSPNTLEIYPNPAKTHFAVRLSHHVNRSTIQIFDVSGTLVKSIEMTKPEIKVSLQGVSSGIYFVQHNNDRTVTKLVVTK